MIHENLLMKKIIWEKLNLPYYSVGYVVLAAMTIYALCSIIDKLAWKRILLLVDRINTKRIDEMIQEGFNECNKKDKVSILIKKV